MSQCPYPSFPPPVPIRLITTPAHQCSYLPDRLATTRAFYVDQLPGRIYHAFMDASFRRSGKVIYQPICAGCRECLPIRVPVAKFAPNKSQRRCFKKNEDLKLQIDVPTATDEKYDLYRRYQSHRHDKEPKMENDRESFENFLYASPVESLEFSYRDPAGKLLGIGICDVCSDSLSTVYFYFDPAVSHRGLGTYGVLREIAFANNHGIPYYYLGFWVAGSPKMNYKTSFKPHQLLQPNGQWVDQ